MTLLEKLLEIQISVDKFIKNGENKSDKYAYVTSDSVLEVIRPKMNEHKLLLEMSVTGHTLHTGETKSGTTRFMTELDVTFKWIDAENGDFREIPFYSQGVDLAGEKGVGKALTYAEKYFLMKYFHVPTSKDDPDTDKRGRTGEKLQAGTQAAKETALYHKKAIMQMLNELCGGDAEKVKQSLKAFTKSESRGFEGNESVGEITGARLPVVFATVKAKYEKKTGKTFAMDECGEEGGA